MSGYLDEYGASDERREKIFKRLAMAVVLLVSVGGILYFLFRDYREKQQIDTFLSLLAQKDYQSAYALWGCTEANPCPDYPYQKFLEDWGPESPHADIAQADVSRTRSCEEGVIRTVKFSEGDEVWLYVDRANRVIAFSPWPVCNPRIPATSLQQ